MFNQQYWSAQYFDPVWFAPADESHLTPDEVYRPTDAGIAPNNLRFEPIRDAEARVKRPPQTSTSAAKARATGDGSADALRAGAFSGVGRVRGVVIANGYAVPKRVYPLIVVVSKMRGESDGVAALRSAGVAAGYRQALPQADGEALTTPKGVGSRVKSVRATGVRNFTDEELVALLARRSLTRRQRSVTTRA